MMRFGGGQGVLGRTLCELDLSQFLRRQETVLKYSTRRGVEMGFKVGRGEKREGKGVGERGAMDAQQGDRY